MPKLVQIATSAEYALSRDGTRQDNEPKPRIFSSMLARLRDRLAQFWARPSTRFLLCGGFAAFVNWATRFPLSWVMPFPAAILVALAIGMTVGFVLYRSLVWPHSARSLLAQIGTFVAVNSVNAAGILVVSIVLANLLGHTSLSRPVAEGLAHAAGIALGAVANFIGHGRFTFAGRRQGLTPSS